MSLLVRRRNILTGFTTGRKRVVKSPTFMFRIPSFIHIYGKETITNPNLKEVASYLKSLLPKAIIDVRSDFISNFFASLDSTKTIPPHPLLVPMLRVGTRYHAAPAPASAGVNLSPRKRGAGGSNEGGESDEAVDSLAEKLASIRVLDYSKQNLNPEPMYAEIDYEKRKILNPSTKSIGVFYDGFELQNIFHALIKKEELSFAHIHIVFINQLIATWEEDDSRYHARSAVYGFPSIISTAGIVEAPAKPREFYLMKQQYGMRGMDDLAIAEFKNKFEGRFIEYDDPRMTEVCKGYAAQALFFHITGEPFCQDKGCRLFNAHWQEELICSQIESPYEFCEKHRDILQNLK